MGEVQLFLGFTNFYPRFIEGFSHIARPLFDLTKAELVFKWSIEEKLAFDRLKDRITSAPILALPDNTTPYRVEADSSDFSTAAVLSSTLHSPIKSSRTLVDYRQTTMVVCWNSTNFEKEWTTMQIWLVS